ncbi:BMC domain-containing protein [Oceanobacillus neutriphilus]|uniref:Ethanolamine utilization protein n=1 Tax=Oceanobacillus neutriphilus TaxID=531815 RepID=A0ABQ2NXC7_9BACI|nr:BMC domain-containing protein [Oceanobacillus neutriphilus]GGP12879.1 ethanolamine utilization protein [Oceanobacillus neutriphilus]
MEALGLIETRGLLSSIVAADAAVKAANVKLLDAEIIKGGLVTVQLLGDVAAVQSAVEAAENAITSFQTLISVHVIPRMHHETSTLLKKLPLQETAPAKLEVEIQPSSVAENKPGIDTKPDYSISGWELENLEKMTVLQLRQLARANDINLLDQAKNIKYARKSELVQALLAKDNNEKKEK